MEAIKQKIQQKRSMDPLESDHQAKSIPEVFSQ
jgi:hypothetical protein